MRRARGTAARDVSAAPRKRRNGSVVKIAFSLDPPQGAPAERRE